jgi:stage V sporulation protein G
MDITGVKVFRTNREGNPKAHVTITFDNQFVVGGLVVMEGKNGAFVQMPQYKTKEGTYKDTSFPLSKDLRQTINDMVLAEYSGQTEPNTEEENEDILPF